MKKLIVVIAFAALCGSTFGQWGFITREMKNDLESLKYNAVRTAVQAVAVADDSVVKNTLILPANAVIWDMEIYQAVNFNDGGVDSLEIGLSADRDYFVEMAVNSGAAAWDSITYKNELPYLVSSADTVKVMYWGGDSDGTAGSAKVYIKYSLY